MFFRNGVVFLFLMLSGCGISVYSHSEYMTFSDVDDVKPYERVLFQSKGMTFRKVYSNQKQRYVSEKKIIDIDDIRFSFTEKDSGLVGVFPLVPPPPYVPVFLKEVNPACPVSSDMKLNISYLDEGKERYVTRVMDYLKLPDVHKIYLIKDDGRAVMPRHIWDDGFSYHVCFPLKPEEANNTILIIDGLEDKQNKHIPVKPQRLRYYNEYIWAMGYLGEYFSCSTGDNRD